jgi:hypothetical protein
VSPAGGPQKKAPEVADTAGGWPSILLIEKHIRGSTPRGTKKEEKGIMRRIIADRKTYPWQSYPRGTKKEKGNHRVSDQKKEKGIGGSQPSSRY